MLRIRDLLVTGCPKWIVPERMQLLCLLILNFCIDCPFGVFQSIRIIIFVHVSNDCLDRPFGFSVNRNAHFCLSRLCRLATYRAVFFLLNFFYLIDFFGYILTKYFLTASVFIRRVSLSPSFVIRHHFAPGIWLKDSVFLSTRSLFFFFLNHGG